jgi:hypothetical protein
LPRQNTCVDKIIGVDNIGVNKILASTKYGRRQNPGLEKILPSIKSWRRRRRITLLSGSAESTAADFSQAQLKISYVSLMVLLSLHAVVKFGIASSRLAFMGGLSPVLYRLIVPARHAENVTNFGADKILVSA